MYESPNFSISLSVLVILVCLFDCGHRVRCKVVSHCGFCFNFPNGSWYWVLFIGYWPFVNLFFFEKCLFRQFYPFLNWDCCLFIELQAFFIYSRHRSFIRYLICKYFILFCGLSFHILDCVLWNTEFLILMKFNLCIFFFHCFHFDVISKNSWNFTPMYSSKKNEFE